jgi:hypothetical protein
MQWHLGMALLRGEQMAAQQVTTGAALIRTGVETRRRPARQRRTARYLNYLFFSALQQVVEAEADKIPCGQTS